MRLISPPQPVTLRNHPLATLLGSSPVLDVNYLSVERQDARRLRRTKSPVVLGIPAKQGVQSGPIEVPLMSNRDDAALTRALERLCGKLDNIRLLGSNTSTIRSRPLVALRREEEKRLARTTPNGLRWMVFVDGENLAIRFQEKALKEYGPEAVTKLSAASFMQDVFVWLPMLEKAPGAMTHFLYRHFVIRPEPVAQYYYTSVSGDRDRILEVREKLWRFGLHPVVFHKESRGRKAKGVDISLTRDLLSQAFLDNYDLAVLFSADGDYVPVIEELRRLGKSVLLFSFGEGDGLNNELRLACNAWEDAWPLFKGYCAAEPRESVADNDPENEQIKWRPVVKQRAIKMRSKIEIVRWGGASSWTVRGAGPNFTAQPEQGETS